MEKAKVQIFLDRMAISASALCMLHCLVTPLLLVTVPVISSTFLVDEEFHKALVTIVLPTSFIALFLGCRRHKDRTAFVLGSLGLIALVSIVYFGHDLLGELGEKFQPSLAVQCWHLLTYETIACAGMMDAMPNNAINANSEKRFAFVAPLFTAGYGER